MNEETHRQQIKCNTIGAQGQGEMEYAWLLQIYYFAFLFLNQYVIHMNSDIFNNNQFFLSDCMRKSITKNYFLYNFSNNNLTNG